MTWEGGGKLRLSVLTVTFGGRGKKVVSPYSDMGREREEGCPVLAVRYGRGGKKVVQSWQQQKEGKRRNLLSPCYKMGRSFKIRHQPSTPSPPPLLVSLRVEVLTSITADEEKDQGSWSHRRSHVRDPTATRRLCPGQIVWCRIRPNVYNWLITQ